MEEWEFSLDALAASINNNDQQSPGKSNRKHQPKKKSKKKKQGIENSLQPTTTVVECDALGPSVPRLVITYTNEESAIAKWLDLHVVNDSNNQQLQYLGLDTETKPCFTKEAAKACKGPDTLQLAKVDGTCLVVHLSCMPKQSNTSQSTLATILKSQTILKAGVSIDGDCSELGQNHSLPTHGRVDLSLLHYHLLRSKKTEPKEQPDGKEETNVNQPMGLKSLTAQYMDGLVLPKKKKIQRSNWAVGPLSPEQIQYAAADAFVGAAILERMMTMMDSGSENNTTTNVLAAVNTEKQQQMKERQAARKRKRKEKAEADAKKKKQKKGATNNVQNGKNNRNNNNQTKSPQPKRKRNNSKSPTNRRHQS